MIDCRTFRDRVHFRADLLGPEREDWERHIAECAPCATLLSEVERIDDAVSTYDFAWTAPQTGRFAVFVEQVDFDPIVQLYRFTGGCVADTLACNDDSAILFGIQQNSLIVFEASEGEVFLFAVAPLRDDPVVLVVLQAPQHRPVLRLHERAHLVLEIVRFQVLGVPALLGRDDRPAVVQVADDVGVLLTAVLGLDVEHPAAVADVGVEAGDQDSPRGSG